MMRTHLYIYTSLTHREDAIPDPRVYALTPTSVSLLKSVGAWDLLGKRHRPFQFMQVPTYLPTYLHAI